MSQIKNRVKKKTKKENQNQKTTWYVPEAANWYIKALQVFGDYFLNNILCEYTSFQPSLLNFDLKLANHISEGKNLIKTKPISLFIIMTKGFESAVCHKNKAHTKGDLATSLPSSIRGITGQQ